MTRLLILGEKQYLIKDTKQKFHANDGYVTPAQLQAASGTKVTTSKGTQGYIIDATFSDIFAKLARKAQIMIPKDIGWIVSATGLDNTKLVVDAGSGSGSAAILLSRYAKRVYSYDIREDHLEQAKKNAEAIGAKNITFKVHDVTKSIPKKDVFLVLLDMAQPWDAIASAHAAVHPGGFIVTYSPSVTQCQQTVTKAEEVGLHHVRTVELIERDWTIDARRCRPAHGALGHTGFLTLLRKIHHGN